MIDYAGLGRNSALVLSLWLAAVPVMADGGGFVGRWHWNRAESRLPPDEAMPEEMIADISRADSAHMKWSITVTDKHGKRDVESFDAPANGEFYPVSSGITAAFRLDGAVIDGTFKGPGEETDTLSCRLSADQKKLTCKGTMTDNGGKSATYVDVYDRY